MNDSVMQANMNGSSSISTSGKFTLSIGVGVLITVPCMLIAAVALAVGGSAMGNDSRVGSMAVVLFPWALLEQFVSSTAREMVMIALAVIQFPFYGAVFALMWHRGKPFWAIAGIIVAHLGLLMLFYLL